MRPRTLSDQALLASAWREYSGTPAARRRKSSGPFKAEYAGYCGRCGRAIDTGQMIQCHKDFDGAVHIGCHAPEVITRTIKDAATPQTRGASTVASRQSQQCPECHLEHAGECW